MKQYFYITTILTLTILLAASTSFAQHLSFDGVDDKVTVNKSGTGILGDYSVPHNFVIETKFSFTGSDPSTLLKKKIIANNEVVMGYNSGFFIETDNYGNLKIGYGVPTSDVLYATSPSPIVLNTAYHVALVYGHSPLEFRVYVNGVEILNYPLGQWGATTFYFVQSTRNMTFADCEGFPGENGKVVFDYVRVWNSSRTAAEILANKDSEVSCTSSGLLAQYKFDDGIAAANNTGITTVSNCVGGGFNGTLNNFAKSGSISNFINDPVFTAALPVELTNFDAEKIDNHVNLNWQTATEKNNEGFEIERSLDGVNWERLGFVIGNGTTQEVQNYDYKDINPFKGDNYYRLKQIDYDGKFEYSDIVFIATTEEAAAKLKLYPTLVESEMTVENGQGNVIIYNSIGQPVKQLNINDEIEKLNVNDLPVGNYIIHIEQNGKIKTDRFVKM